jgi:hypothetical protein
MTKEQIQAEAIDRARNGQSFSNYPAIFAGFMAKGIAEADIKPRENVFTFNAWKALGRSVKRGEHGVKVMTFITVDGKSEIDESTGAETVTAGYRKPHVTTVFHVSQTESTAERELRLAQSRPLGSGPLHWPRAKRLRHARAIARFERRASDFRNNGGFDPGEYAADQWSAADCPSDNS